jgi:hypothetical protein
MEYAVLLEALVALVVVVERIQVSVEPELVSKEVMVDPRAHHVVLVQAAEGREVLVEIHLAQPAETQETVYSTHSTSVEPVHNI